MLRLNFSRISLDRKDLEFHAQTHRRRQVARDLNRSPIDLDQRHKGSIISINHQKSRSLQSPVRCLTNLSLGSSQQEPYDKDAIISRDPVPRGSRAFWDKVLAEAGTPTRTQDIVSGHGRVMEPSEEWLENHHSSRASVDSEDDQMSSDEIQGLSNMPRGHSSLNSVYSAHTSIQDTMTRWKGVTASLESIRHSTKQSRFSNFFRRRPRSFDAVEEFQQQEVLDLGMDGHRSEIHQQHDGEQSTSSGTSQTYSISDGLYGNRRDRRTISSSLETSVIPGLMPYQHIATERTQLPYKLSSTNPRHVSRAVSRSPLQISEVTIPSSPKTSSTVPDVNQSLSFGKLPNLVSLQARRHRTYRPRSQTYSYEISEASSATTHTKGRPSTPANLTLQDSLPITNDTSHLVTSATSLLSRRSSRSPTMSLNCPRTPTAMQNYRMTSHETSFSNPSSSFASSRRSLSPLALPFIPSTTPNRNLTPQYQLPPPFGSTPRTVSYSHVLPIASSPATTFVISPSHLSHPSSSDPNATPALTPTTPPRSSFRVYDDSEPPQIQPQTPADLHQRRRLNLPRTVPSYHTHMTPIEHGLARWQAFASPGTGRTPSRLRPEANPLRMGDMVSPDIENQDTITSSERETRRAWNGALRIGQEERREWI